MGSAWLSGINLYAAVLTLGLLQRFHLAKLPGDLGILSQTWVLTAAGVLTRSSSSRTKFRRSIRPGTPSIRLSAFPQEQFWRPRAEIAWSEGSDATRRRYLARAFFKYRFELIRGCGGDRFVRASRLPPGGNPGGACGVPAARDVDCSQDFRGFAGPVRPRPQQRYRGLSVLVYSKSF